MGLFRISELYHLKRLEIELRNATSGFCEVIKNEIVKMVGFSSLGI
jgi:hypothetical protein